MLKKLAIATLLVLFPLSAIAGTLTQDQDDEDSMRYTSYLGYSALIPKGWTKLDASVIGAMEEHYPRNIPSKAIGQVDVVFYPYINEPVTTLEADDKRIEANKTAETKAKPVTEEPLDKDFEYYAPTIAVSILENYNDTVDQPKNKTALFKDEMKKFIESSSHLSEAKVFSETYEEDLELFIFKYNVKSKINKEKKLFVIEQYVKLGSSNNAFVVTCTKLDDENALNEKLIVESGWCKNFVRSMTFND